MTCLFYTDIMESSNISFASLNLKQWKIRCDLIDSNKTKKHSVNTFIKKHTIKVGIKNLNTFLVCLSNKRCTKDTLSARFTKVGQM